LYKSPTAYKSVKSKYKNQASGNISLSPEAPLNFSFLTDNDFDIEIEKGFASMEAGKVVSSNNVRRILKHKYVI
jgi:hypothetical protein